MTHGIVSERELRAVFTDIGLVYGTSNGVNASGEATFVFKTSDDDGSYGGPTVVCSLATDVANTPAEEVQKEFLLMALKMLRRIASMTDDEILESCRNSIGEALERDGHA